MEWSEIEWFELKVKSWTLFSNETLIKKRSRESFSIFYITHSCSQNNFTYVLIKSRVTA